MRIGFGYDAHRFEEGRKLVLGGISIPHTQGLAAHSDGDVVLHALCDALLGAAALGDIGKHFPDTDEQYHGADSRVLLRKVVALAGSRILMVENCDLTIVAQEPKLAGFIESMCSNIATDLGVGEGRVNVKATTTEYMGFTGRKEGIAAYAVCLLTQSD